jgi:hypothetical protein
MGEIHSSTVNNKKKAVKSYGSSAFGESGLIRGMTFGESGLIRGMTFGESGLIRGMTFGESGLIRGELL